MNPTEIEFAVRDLVAKPYDPDTFPFELMACYNASKVTVSKLKSGQTNAATQPGDVLWKKHLFFRPAAAHEDVGAIGDALRSDSLVAKQKPRFIVVSNGEQVHIRDLKLDDTVNVEYGRLDEASDFLLPLAGYERRTVVEEHPADIKAAKKLKKLYDAILAANPTWSAGHHTHELNLLMTRLLFCFYAEDTGIFDTPQIFTNTVTQYTTEDGSDVAMLLDRLFRIMNVADPDRPKTTPAVDAKFPYVNGSLFEDTVEIPDFSRTARRLLLECGDLDWTTINPDIFGSMIQTIAQDGTRSDLGMHYTSVPNIMKVLQPLFLDDLHEAYEKAKDSVPKLEALLGRLAKIRVFDPACGSGNFLIIAYKALRTLEIQTLERISNIAPKTPLRFSGISLEHFYGIDVVDFASETAKLSLWIAEHQMNAAFEKAFGTARAMLPLEKITTIRCGNAVLQNWASVCPPDESAETYLCGNPPYLGAKWQNVDQKRDIATLFQSKLKNYGNLDYIACWFYKAALFISTQKRAKASFVSTNSVCQGEMVPLLWPLLFEHDLDIAFAQTSFKWSNSASHNAGVSCVIIGLEPRSSEPKHIICGDSIQVVPHIGPYLSPSSTNIIVHKEQRSLSDLPAMLFGNMPRDGGHLILSPQERSAILASYPHAEKFIRAYMGADEFVNSIERYCIWITDDLREEASKIPPLAARIAQVVSFRRHSNAESTRQYANQPHRFVQIQGWGKPALLVPTVTSERRKYLQIGFADSGTIINNLVFAVYNPPQYLFALLSSRLHRTWTSSVGGKLEDRLRYSNGLIYNTFPVPKLSNEQQRILADHSREILKARAKHPGKTIASLYNPETMPSNLLDIHQQNDAYIEEHIYGRSFRDDAQRLEHLFAMYERLKSGDHTLGLGG